MELLIYNYTGFEREFEVSVKNNGKISFEFYVTDSDIRLSMDEDGYGYAKINDVSCIIYDENDEPKPYTLTEQQIIQLENELVEYVDWDRWLEQTREPENPYNE